MLLIVVDECLSQMNILLILKQACDAREVFILSAGDIDISFFSGYKRRVS